MSLRYSSSRQFWPASSGTRNARKLSLARGFVGSGDVSAAAANAPVGKGQVVVEVRDVVHNRVDQGAAGSGRERGVWWGDTDAVDRLHGGLRDGFEAIKSGWPREVLLKILRNPEKILRPRINDLPVIDDAFGPAGGFGPRRSGAHPGRRLVSRPCRQRTAPGQRSDPARTESDRGAAGLARHPGQVASRDELLRVWPGVVGDDALTQTILKLRKALGDEARHPRYIETISKRGYRLIAAVRPAGESRQPCRRSTQWRGPEPLLRQPQPPTPDRRSWRRAAALAGGLAAAVVATIVVIGGGAGGGTGCAGRRTRRPGPAGSAAPADRRRAAARPT